MAIYTEERKVTVVGMPNGEIEEIAIVTDLKDGKAIGSAKHIRVIAPNADLTIETEKIKAVARGIWTPATVAALTAIQQTEIDKYKAATVSHKAAKAEADAAKVLADKAIADKLAAQATLAAMK